MRAEQTHSSLLQGGQVPAVQNAVDISQLTICCHLCLHRTTDLTACCLSDNVIPAAVFQASLLCCRHNWCQAAQSARRSCNLERALHCDGQQRPLQADPEQQKCKSHAD